MLIGGIILVAAAVAAGEADVSLLLIFPVFSGSGWLFLLGVLLIVASFLVGFAIIAMSQTGPELGHIGPPAPTNQSETTKKSEFGGVVLIGPVPVAFGSSRGIALVMLVIGVVLAVLLLGLILAL